MVRNASLDDDFDDFMNPPPISYAEILNNNDLTGHHHYNQWRERLDRYLVQEGLQYVVEHPYRAPLLSLTPGEDERTNWIEYFIGQAKVKAILLHTIPLANFKENKDRHAYDIMTNVAQECATASMREEELNRAATKKRKIGSGDGGSARHQI